MACTQPDVSLSPQLRIFRHIKESCSYVLGDTLKPPGTTRALPPRQLIRGHVIHRTAHADFNRKNTNGPVKQLYQQQHIHSSGLK